MDVLSDCPSAGAQDFLDPTVAPLPQDTQQEGDRVDKGDPQKKLEGYLRNAQMGDKVVEPGDEQGMIQIDQEAGPVHLLGKGRQADGKPQRQGVQGGDGGELVQGVERLQEGIDIKGTGCPFTKSCQLQNTSAAARNAASTASRVKLSRSSWVKAS